MDKTASAPFMCQSGSGQCASPVLTRFKGPMKTVPKTPKALAEARAKPASSLKAQEPFWHKGLENLTKKEWESLCDGCGRCCLVKLEDEDTGEIHFTDIACKLFDAGACQCKNYPQRQEYVTDCIKLTPEKVKTLPWLPPTCAYRLVEDARSCAGGIRLFPALPKPFTRPEFPCGAGWGPWKARSGCATTSTV